MQNLVDSDELFIINPITREIHTETKKLYLMQHDHNSEIIRFQVPKIIEGYDITQCNRVEIHYTNINSRTKEVNSNIYVVSDMVADEGKILTNGTERVFCLDTDNPDGWSEVDH